MQLADTQILPAPLAPAPAPRSIERCEACEAPVEATQRYCVVCGQHRRHVPDPASAYLAQAAAPARSVRRAAVRPRSRRGGGAGLGTALVLALIPAAVAVGLAVGRDSGSGDSKLLAALRAQRPEIASTAGTGAAAAGTASGTPTPVGTLTSTYPLTQGFAVELRTVATSTSPSTVSSDEQAASAKGAKDVGLILPSDFSVTPAAASGQAVIYAGAFHTRAEAAAALAKLKKSFPGAQVVAVKRSGGVTVTGGGQALAHTSYGTAHQVAGFTPSSSQLAQGGQIVRQQQQQQGKSYVNSQRGLPDTIAVP